jgi:uncharacterized repeat protein (TIGR04076 family)
LTLYALHDYTGLLQQEVITEREGKMAEMYEVIARVISQKGTCGAGHKVGDEWVISGKTPEGICLSAFDALSPATRVLIFGGSFPWGNDPDVTTIACTDAANPVVFELRRVR